MKISALSVRRLAVASSLVVLGITAWSCATASGLESSSMHVQFTDLDLTTSAGRQIANERLRKAAHTVCDRVSDHLDLGHDAHVAACVNRLMPKANVALAQVVARSESIQVANSPNR